MIEFSKMKNLNFGHNEGIIVFYWSNNSMREGWFLHTFLWSWIYIVVVLIKYSFTQKKNIMSNISVKINENLMKDDDVKLINLFDFPSLFFWKFFEVLCTKNCIMLTDMRHMLMTVLSKQNALINYKWWRLDLCFKMT